MKPPQWHLSFALSHNELHSATLTLRAVPLSLTRRILRIVLVALGCALVALVCLRLSALASTHLPAGLPAWTILPGLLLAVVPVALLLGFGLFVRLFGRPAVSAGDHRPQSLDLWTNRFVITCGTSRVMYRWRAIRRIEEDDLVFLLVLDQSIAFALPKRAVGDTAAVHAFRHFLHARVGRHVYGFPVEPQPGARPAHPAGQLPPAPAKMRDT